MYFCYLGASSNSSADIKQHLPHFQIGISFFCIDVVEMHALFPGKISINNYWTAAVLLLVQRFITFFS
jgi:hypothetical protein